MSLSIVVLGDQLLDDHPVVPDPTDEVRVVLIESQKKLRSRAYHQQKQVLVLSAMRHYAARLRARGYTVDYYAAPSMSAGLRQHLIEQRPSALRTMAASEYDARQQQALWSARLGLPVEIIPNSQFLVGQHDPFPGSQKRVVMETFYRQMRRHFCLLMEDDEPVGGRWNFDDENRKPLKKGLQPPPIPRFEPDDITQQVIAEVKRSDHGVGQADTFAYAVTHEQAQTALADFIQYRLPLFGAYEDAMSSRYPTLYHSVLSPYINLGLLTPLEVARAAEAAYHRGEAPLNSVEGFIRQIVGWREYMMWQYWRMMPELRDSNSWGAQRLLPDWFWSGDTQMNCLRHVIEQARETAYSHHIQRLMIVTNFCLLTGIEPRAVVEWFMSFYIDAYDWVMQPNTVGMGLNADGGQTATKPYIASATYINRMSDYCQTCAYDPKARSGEHACPFNTLYWNFLLTHENQLRANPRLGPAVLGLKHLSADERIQIRQQAEHFLSHL